MIRKNNNNQAASYQMRRVIFVINAGFSGEKDQNIAMFVLDVLLHLIIIVFG
jgi:hypothetical protein